MPRMERGIGGLVVLVFDGVVGCYGAVTFWVACPYFTEGGDYGGCVSIFLLFPVRLC